MYIEYIISYREYVIHEYMYKDILTWIFLRKRAKIYF